FITTGIYHRPNNLDYLTYVADPVIQASLKEGTGGLVRALIMKMPQVPIPNYAYRNNGDLTFTNMARAWGLGQPGFSNGAAYVDLNNSGALDLVVSKIDAPAAIYRNRARALTGNHYLQVVLKGSGANTAGIGAKVVIREGGKGGTGGKVQMLEQFPTRGFQSSVDPRLHFGLGSAEQIDSLMVIWPDRRHQVLTRVAVDRTLTLSQQDATGSSPGLRPGSVGHSPASAAQPLFTDVTERLAIDFTHHENRFYDFHREPLIPHFLSTEGPALAIADVDRDGRDDIYVGGAKWQAGRLFIQRRDGTFRDSPQRAFQIDSLSEDVDAVFFDANGDGRPDLYVVSGGNEFEKDDAPLQDRLYLNDGHGQFHRDSLALPRLSKSGSCVVPGDWSGAGRPDLVVGNLGLNSYLQAAPGEPARLFVGDCGHNGTREQVLTFYKQGVSYPLAGRDEFAGLIPRLRTRYATYADFGAARVEDIFPAGDLAQATVREAHMFASSVALNNGNGTFTVRPLPAEAQFAPIRAVLVDDFDGNGRPDLLVGGNLDGVPPVLVRYDASHGLLLSGTG